MNLLWCLVFCLTVCLVLNRGNCKRIKRGIIHKNFPTQSDEIDFDEEEEEEEEEEGEADEAATTVHKVDRASAPVKSSGERPSKNGDGESSTARGIDDVPKGPVVLEEQLEDRYLTKFTPDAEHKVTFIEPEVLPNCWVQAMLSNKYHFAAQCNGDGSFASKQCFQERCWCTNRDGSPQVKTKDKRFYYEIRGITLRCVQNGIPV